MGWFKSSSARELDAIIRRIEMNMSNNYKDAAQENLKDFEATMNMSLSNGILKDKEKAYYESQLGIYREKMKGFTHKDQKPYWS